MGSTAATVSGPAARAARRDVCFGSSARLFHALHAGHWPCQRGVSLPHSVQK
jgi:hypothetical protein